MEHMTSNGSMRQPSKEVLSPSFLRERMHEYGKGDAFTYRNAAVASCQRLGRRIWKVWIGYRRPSLLEAKMNCVKRLGERVMSRNVERQVNQLIRAAILNRFTKLGPPQTAAMALLRLGAGVTQPRLDLCSNAIQRCNAIGILNPCLFK